MSLSVFSNFLKFQSIHTRRIHSLTSLPAARLLGIFVARAKIYIFYEKAMRPTHAAFFILEIEYYYDYHNVKQLSTHIFIYSRLM